MEYKLYLILDSKSKEENDSLLLGVNVLLSHLRSDPYVLECMRLIVLNSKGIVFDKPILENFNIGIVQTNTDGDLKKLLITIIEDLNSKPRDKIYTIVLCFSLTTTNLDISEELNELNKITQGVSLITKFEYFDHYQQYFFAEENINSKKGLRRLISIENFNVEFLKDIFSYNYIEAEISDGGPPGYGSPDINKYEKELPPAPPEITDIFSSEFTNLKSKDTNMSEDQLRKFVGKIFLDLNLSAYLIICSKACVNGPDDIEWLIIPKIELLPGQESDIIEDLKKEYNICRRMGTRYFYKLKFNSNHEFIFTYGKIDCDVVDDDIEYKFQPALILHRTELLESFMKFIFNNIDKYPPNKLWWN